MRDSISAIVCDTELAVTVRIGTDLGEFERTGGSVGREHTEHTIASGVGPFWVGWAWAGLGESDPTGVQ